MSASDFTKYDDVLTSILVNEKSILGFLSAIFNFLARRTDFYYVPEGSYENMGFPPGMAEELVVKVIRSCDPKTWNKSNEIKKITESTDINNEIMCSTVAQEVEVIADDETMSNNELCDGTENIHLNTVETQQQYKKVGLQINKSTAPQSSIIKQSTGDTEQSNIKTSNSKEKLNNPEDYEPPVIPVQKNSEAYNGAVCDKYTWSQTIMELDAIIKLPPNTKSKDLKVTINPEDVYIAHHNGDIIIKDSLPYKIKTIDSFWSISEGRLLLHLEKVQERWWNRFINVEEPIDLSKIDCSRPLEELPEDHIAKIRELQWNQERKLRNLPTSDEIRNIEILKKAWNAEGSPFKGTEFNPNVLNPQ